MYEIRKMYENCLYDIGKANSPNEEYAIPTEEWFYELVNNKTHPYYKKYMKPYLRKLKIKKIVTN